MTPISPQSLLIVSHVCHYQYDGKLYAYSPYVREVDIWAEIFPQVVIASPCRKEPPPGDCAAFARHNISIAPQKEAGGENLTAKIGLLLSLPTMIWKLCRAMRQTDAIHVRCPGNTGLLGVCLAPLFSKYLIAKYAGQWTPYSGEARTVALQRRLLGSSWWRGPVTVYGAWENQSAHVVPFFTTVMTADQIALARNASNQKHTHSPLRVLFVGRLSAAKNVDCLIQAVAQVREQGIALSLTLVGEGRMRSSLEALVQELSLSDSVSFVGGLNFEQVLQCYAESDVLVLASETEGWPKAIAEGMAFGLICIGSQRGLIPQMLAEGRGLVVEPRDTEALAQNLLAIARSPDDYQTMRQTAAQWGQRYSLEQLRDALRELMETRWGVMLPSVSDTKGVPTQ